jgi:hypothetical protein
MPNSVPELIPDTDTTNIRPIATRYDRASGLWGVNEFVKPIRDHPSVTGTEIQTASTNLHGLLRFHTTILLNLDRCANDIEFGKTFSYVSDNPRAEARIKEVSSMNRFSFAVMANFFIEVILRCLISKFGSTSPDGFYKVAQKAIELANLPDPQKEHFNALTVLSKVRNTLHNNGVYMGYNETIAHFDLAGVQYSFTHGDVIRECVTWDHLAHGLACALKTTKEILDKFSK